MPRHWQNTHTAVGVALVAILLSATVTGAEATRIRDGSATLAPVTAPAFTGAHPDDYTGWLRLYVVEPASMWSDRNGRPFQFGFLAFALDSAITVPNGSRYHRTVMWDASDAGFWAASDTNIMVIAVLFNSDPHQGYSDPPTGSPFTAYYTDAAAGAIPGASDSNKTIPGWTHTVFVQFAATSTCSACPTTNYYLPPVYAAGTHNFYFASMVVDRNSKASSFMNLQYNLEWVPTCYGDGGDEVMIGGYSPGTPYANMVAACGARSVPDVGLIVTWDWLEEDHYQIEVAVTHGVATNTPPSAPQDPAGETFGLIDTSYQYSTVATDAEDEGLFCRWSWGNGDTSEWLGPFASGDTATASYAWAEQGTYDVTVQIRDLWKHGSGWSNPLTVTLTCCANRGNADGLISAGGPVDVADLTYLVGYLFLGGPPPPCEKEGNIDGLLSAGGPIDVADLTYLVSYLFLAGPPPPECD